MDKFRTYRLWKIICTLSLWLVHFSFAGLAEEELPDVPPGAIAPIDTLFDTPLSRALDLVYQDRYEESVALLDSLKRAFPDHPAPYFYLGAAYQAWMSSYRFNHFQQELEDNIQSAIEKGNELLDVAKEDPWLNFYVGAAYGYRAFYRVRRFNWIGAFLDGKKGVGNFYKALEKEPELYDVYLGLGSYHYWRTARSGFIRVVAFWMKDKRDLGIEQIDFSVKHGRYTPNEASFALVTSLYDYQKYDRALEALERYESWVTTTIISNLYFRGLLLAHFERWPEVTEVFQEILSRLVDYSYQSIGYQVECKYWLARALAAEKKLQEAQSLAEDAFLHGKERNKDAELEGPLYGFDEIEDWLRDLNKELKKKIAQSSSQ